MHTSCGILLLWVYFVGQTLLISTVQTRNLFSFDLVLPCLRQPSFYSDFVALPLDETMVQS
jgi:hypothetical protein